MLKSKIKLSLIDDYIKIITIKNFCDNHFIDCEINFDYEKMIKKTKVLSQNLQLLYELVFAKLKLNTLSFDILKSQLYKNNNLFIKTKKQNFLHLEEVCNINIIQLSNISSSLKDKLTKLKLDPVKLISEKTL